ncbi:MAG: TonB-dependent receptor [Niabella sp.]|nr:TonB-dependent receptor [Niabella sp.]
MFKKIYLLVIFALSSTILINAQVTTSSVTGKVTDAGGAPLVGATVTLTHTPSGTVYNTVTQNGGNFTIQGMRTGGPYSAKITYAGKTPYTQDEITLNLGEGFAINAQLADENGSLKEVIVTGTAKSGIISPLRNGPSAIVNARQIQSLPSINNSVQDYVRFMPQVKVGNGGTDGNATGMSFGGQSNRYNQFTIDGANASDVFGLGSTGTNGGQANVNPISMQAIQELQVVMAPYDVSQGGFTGGGINAVTKSGTNTFHGSAYFQGQNQGFVGKGAKYNDNVTSKNFGDFTNRTMGANLGGPIIKNKLFFFVNVESYKKSTPLAFDPTQPGSGSQVNKDTLEYIRQQMISKYNFDPGSYGAINNTNKSTSAFARIDWNINDKNKLMLRFNHVEGSTTIMSRGPNSAIFSNSGYGFSDKNNSFVAELNSNFSSRSSNMLRLTYTSVRDARTTAQFPNVAIYNYNPDSKTTVLYGIGSEYSSAVNGLNQNVFTLTDNFNLYRGSHTLTFGTANTFYKSTNLFLQGYFGAYTYGASGTSSSSNINNFLNNTGLTTYQIGFSTSADRGDKAPADLKAAQFSVYGQDMWKINPQFRLTYGLRIDMPAFFNKPVANPTFATEFPGYATSQMPKSNPLFSPRAGFNYDVNGDGKTQLRGGAGIFTGNIPFVWISNQISTTGMASQNITYTGNNITANNIKFNYDPTDPHMGAFVPAPSAAKGSVINVIDKNFKFPQVFRGNLGLDQRLPFWGLIGTVEGVFTKTMHNALYTNINLAQGGTGTVTIGPTTRPYWGSYVNPDFGNVLYLTNTNKGYGYTLTAQLQKPYSRGWSGSIAYSYGNGKSLNDLPSSVAQSNWRGPYVVNGLNNPDLSISNFAMGSRIVGFASKEFRYANNKAATTITLTYTGQAGQRLSYLYNNNILGDYTVGSTSGSDALIYVPASASEANFVDIYQKNSAGVNVLVTKASDQWTNFQNLVNNTPYLKDNQGKNTARNGDHLPWENHFDLRVAQSFTFKYGIKLELFATMMNVGNFINSKWGWSYGTGSYPDGFYPTSASILNVVSSGVQTRDGVAVATPTAANPYFQFNQNNLTNVKGTYRPYYVNDFTSRWNAIAGIKLSF